MALALGGMTVDELKNRMSMDELSRWGMYSREVGPLNPFLRLDAAIARAVSPFVKGDKRSLMPWPKKDEQEATLEDFMKILGGAKK